MSTFSTISSAVQSNLGRSDTNTQTMIRTAFNTIQKLLAVSNEWEDLQRVNSALTLTSGVNEYSVSSFLASTFYKLDSFKVYDNSRWQKPLIQVTPSKWDSELAHQLPNGNRRPEFLMMYKKYLYLAPIPDQGYTCEARYYVLPTDVSAGQDPDLPISNIDSVFENAVTGLVWAGLEETELAKFFLGLADSVVKEFVKGERNLLNFSALVSPKNNAATSNTSQPWTDPFRKGDN